MGKARCGRGHLYDTDLYPTCPYCNNADAWINLDPSKGTQDGIKVTDENITRPIDESVMGKRKVTDPNKTVPTKEALKKAEKLLTEENKTQSLFSEMFSETAAQDPVVGWLVCTEGSQKGRDFKLYGRINRIGRSDDMDVVIKGDNTISEKNHARVSYDYKNNKFKLIPAESVNVIYINDDTLDIPVILKPYDVIDFGKTKLVFVPFCCEQFKWNKDKKDEGQ